MSQYCEDCEKDTLEGRRDYYMVTNALWKAYGVGKLMLCITCLERRMGRTIQDSDLIDCDINKNFNSYTKIILNK